ncbi:MAG: EFR1 family ferrodoxin [Candidatus Lokiarchaeota archaeon]|nr:EFR1 family ferrodoxin [Candidatus Lokiarchaeota archaeon]
MNPKKICIYYFSGTGNTELVSKLFCKEFRKQGAKADIIAVEEILKGKISINMKDYDLLGFGHPVHAFSTPRIFFEFIKSLPPAEVIPSFYFRTAGDPLCNGGATSMVRKILQRKKYKVFHESLLVMPTNVIIQYEDELIKQLFNAAKRNISKIVKEVLHNESHLQKNSLILRIISYLFNKAETIGAKYFGRYLYVTDSCDQCNLCISKCPTGNIYEDSESREIKFEKKCTFCLKCVYLCPNNSIKNKYMNLFIINNGYNIRKVIKNPRVKGIYVTEATKGYFKHFYKYLYNVE